MGATSSTPNTRANKNASQDAPGLGHLEPNGVRALRGLLDIVGPDGSDVDLKLDERWPRVPTEPLTYTRDIGKMSQPQCGLGRSNRAHLTNETLLLST